MAKKIIPLLGAALAVFAALFCIRAIVTGNSRGADIETDRDSLNSSGSYTYEESSSDFASPTLVTVADSNTFLNESTTALPPTGLTGEVTSRTAAAPAATTRPGTSAPSSTAARTAAGTTAATLPSTSAAPATTASTTASTTKAALSDYEYSYAGFNPQPADLNVADWTLILVNRDYILPEGFVPPELVPSVKSDSDSKKLDSRVAPHYNDMYLAAKKDGITLETVSGYRSYSLQRTNFENKISKYINQGMNRTKATQEAAKIILPPGTSEHNLGFAMDICSLEQSFENTKAFRWLCENAEDYGFILRYPKDKQDITQIIYEPWHWRYVGVENAKRINASGKCLEEYLGKV